MTRKVQLAPLLKKIFILLKQVELDKEAYDVVWHGPYFIFRPGEWYPSHFVLYNGTLYCELVIEGSYYAISWEIGAKEIKFEQSLGISGPFSNNEYLWEEALSQIYKRLQSAVKNPNNYNRRVERLFPFACRSGKIKRHFTWEKKIKSIIPMTKIYQLEELLKKSAKLPKLSEMTLRMYLEVVGIAKDAVFKDSRKLSLIEKYQRRADMRHGGMLDLPLDDAKAFKDWYHSGRWAGSHPWEIVFGHPHGIMIAAHHEGEKGWNYALWVDSLGWYTTAALMALALGKKKIPFEFHRSEKVLNALKGIDDVEVGPFLGLDSVHLEELKESRPDALPYIRWDPIPQIALISPEQTKRVMTAEQKK